MDGQADLLGQWCLMKEWGRTGSAGQRRLIAFPAHAEAVSALDSQRRARNEEVTNKLDKRNAVSTGQSLRTVPLLKELCC